jgi:hypothetical protein
MANQDQGSIADLYKDFGTSSKNLGNDKQGVVYFDPEAVLLHGHTHSVAS